MPAPFKNWLGLYDKKSFLRIPQQEEAESALLLGDPGTGKSQMLHQAFGQILTHRPAEAIICYDPVGEFVKAYYDPEQDLIFNPTDERCPYWSPADEILQDIDCEFIAESFFPGRQSSVKQ